MKRLMLFFAALVMCGAMYAQGVLTLVGGNAYDGFVSIRQSPSSKARVLGKLYNVDGGMFDGLKLGKQGNWTKVKFGGVVGWCYSKYVQEISWYDGSGRYIIVAAKANTPIYGEQNEEGDPAWVTVPKGTIIADYNSEDIVEGENNFVDIGDGCYILRTGHWCYWVSKSDVIVKRRY